MSPRPERRGGRRGRRGGREPPGRAAPRGGGGAGGRLPGRGAAAAAACERGPGPGARRWGSRWAASGSRAPGSSRRLSTSSSRGDCGGAARPGRRAAGGRWPGATPREASISSPSTVRGRAGGRAAGRGPGRTRGEGVRPSALAPRQRVGCGGSGRDRPSSPPSFVVVGLTGGGEGCGSCRGEERRLLQAGRAGQPLPLLPRPGGCSPRPGPEPGSELRAGETSPRGWGKRGASPRHPQAGARARWHHQQSKLAVLGSCHCSGS